MMIDEIKDIIEEVKTVHLYLKVTVNFTIYF